MALNGFVAKCLITIGSKLWADKGRNNNKGYYKDLTIIGKLGYRIFCAGLRLIGIKTQEDFDEFIDYTSS